MRIRSRSDRALTSLNQRVQSKCFTVIGIFVFSTLCNVLSTCYEPIFDLRHIAQSTRCDDSIIGVFMLQSVTTVDFYAATCDDFSRRLCKTFDLQITIFFRF